MVTIGTIQVEGQDISIGNAIFCSSYLSGTLQTKLLDGTSADILEAPDRYMFVLDMPGLESGNIKVKVENNILHIAGKIKKKNRQLRPEIKVIRMERRRARYMRKFSLPGDSNVEGIKATYKDGVLTVTVAKRQPSDTEKPKSVTIPIS